MLPIQFWCVQRRSKLQARPTASMLHTWVYGQSHPTIKWKKTQHGSAGLRLHWTRYSIHPTTATRSGFFGNSPKSQHVSKFIVIITHDADNGYCGPSCFRFTLDSNSTLECANALCNEISTKFPLKHSVRPFKSFTFEGFTVNSLIFRSKRDGKCIFVMNLSWPAANSFNDFLDVKDFHVSSCCIDNAAGLFVIFWRRSHQGKAWLRHVFRLVPAWLADWNLLSSWCNG